MQWGSTVPSQGPANCQEAGCTGLSCPWPTQASSASSALATQHGHPNRPDQGKAWVLGIYEACAGLAGHRAVGP